MTLTSTETPYDSLSNVYSMAFEQASAGKGKERHADADNEPFERQVICEMARRLGSPFCPSYQAVKKIYEASKMEDPDRAIHELIGALNYVAATVILLQEKKREQS